MKFNINNISSIINCEEDYYKGTLAAELGKKLYARGAWSPFGIGQHESMLLRGLFEGLGPRGP